MTGTTNTPGTSERRSGKPILSSNGKMKSFPNVPTVTRDLSAEVFIGLNNKKKQIDVLEVADGEQDE